MRALLLLALGLAACDPAPPAEEVCPANVSPRVLPQDRKVLGQGAPYPADLALRGQDAALAGSQRLRREAAWRTVEKIVAPVGVSAGGQLPRWQTWYGKDDLARVFQRLYEGLGAEGRARRDGFSEAALDEAFGWNVDAVDTLPGWDEERWNAYREAMDRQVELAAAGGVGRVGYSPAAARHLLGSYGELLACAKAGVPPEFVDGPPEAERRLERREVELGACEARRFGPYFVAGGETLKVSYEGTARVAVNGAGCAGGACEIAGPGAFEVTLHSVEATRGALSVDYRAPSPEWSACLTSGFAGDAVVIKSDWRRVLPNMPAPVYDTSAAGLKRHVEHGAWAPDATADPGPDDIYTLELPGGQIYRLVGLHIMSKELDHWQWVTLWWAPDADEDFGADRPASIPGVWRNYKMCTATHFAEKDPLPDGGYGGSLGAALAVVHGEDSWCSNPNLEHGAGNSATNCLGCHQHGGTNKPSEDILAAEDRGRGERRNNFPADYSWAVDRGDALTAYFREVVAYWDAAD